MTKRQLWLLGGSAGVIFTLVSLPLAIALPAAPPDDSGIAARKAERSVWAGTLRDVSVAGLPLGDMNVALRPWALLLGEAQLRFATNTLRGTLVAASGSAGMTDATGAIDLAGRLRPLPVASLGLEDVSVMFRDGRCASARGRVRAVVAGDIGGLALPAGLSGTARCDGTKLLLPLTGQSGMERIDLRVGQRGDWRADVSVRTSDPMLAARLLTAGFATGPGGYTFRLTGAL